MKNHNEFRLLTEDEMEILTLEMYKHGSYSPSYGDEKEAMPGIEILDEVEDVQKRKEMISKTESGTAASELNDLSVIFPFFRFILNEALVSFFLVFLVF